MAHLQLDGEGVELAAAHTAYVGRGGGMAGEVGGPEVAVVVHAEDLEAGGLEEPPQLLRIEETVLRVVLDLLHIALRVVHAPALADGGSEAFQQPTRAASDVQDRFGRRGEIAGEGLAAHTPHSVAGVGKDEVVEPRLVIEEASH